VLTAIPSLGKTGSGVSQTLIGFLRSIPSTFRYVGQAQNVGNILARNAIFSFFVVVIPALAPVLLLKELRLDASSLGLVFASMGVGSIISAIYVIPWLRSRSTTVALMIIAQVTLAGVYILMAMVHHCLYCLVPMALAGATWTLAASELWPPVDSGRAALFRLNRQKSFKGDSSGADFFLRVLIGSGF
jgi:hypothetical protein